MRSSVLLALLVLPAVASAVPMTLDHQGRLFDSLGSPLDGSNDLSIALYDTPSGGSPVWSHDYSGHAFDNGYFHVVLGGAGSTALDLDDFDGDDLWLELAVNTGPALPRLAIGSTAFAFRAAVADAVDGGTVNATEVQVNGTTVIDSSGMIDAARISGGISDTLADLGCSDGQVAAVVSGAWTCSAAGAHTHAPADVVGVLDVSQLPVGLSNAHVAAGDHGHTAADVGALPDSGGTLTGNLSVNGSVQVSDDTGTCNGAKAGTLRWANDQLDVCDGSGWRRVVGAYNPDGSTPANAGLSCKQIHDDGLDTGDGVYWLDPDQPGVGNPPFEAYCDMTLDGGGWQLLGWLRNGGATYTYGHHWSNYVATTPTITPATVGMADFMEDIPTAMGSANLNVRMTYARATQSTLDISSGTTRMHTSASSWQGVLKENEPTGLPGSARESVDHNCTGYSYTNSSGSTTNLTRGCYIELSNNHTGSWAGCGQNDYATGSTGGAVFNLCFDNGVPTGTLSNGALSLWHSGAPTYHEVYEHGYMSNAPANGAYNSAGGNWTWSAWIRPE